MRSRVRVPCSVLVLDGNETDNLTESMFNAKTAGFGFADLTFMNWDQARQGHPWWFMPFPCSSAFQAIDVQAHGPRILGRDVPRFAAMTAFVDDIRDGHRWPFLGV